GTLNISRIHKLAIGIICSPSGVFTTAKPCKAYRGIVGKESDINNQVFITLNAGCTTGCTGVLHTNTIIRVTATVPDAYSRSCGASQAIQVYAVKTIAR